MKAAEQAPPELPGLTFVKPLGSGGYSEVYLYEQSMPRMRVAVKVLSAQGISEQVRQRFTAEANAMAELADHPNIVQVFRADTTPDGRPYLVMKYYPQRNLAVRAKSEVISVPEVLAIGVRISCAVETAHRAGILHRDIKPANILTSQYGEPGLADFGIATTKDEASGESEGMSIPWAAPEVLFNTSPADERSDIYAIGATLWHLLVGRSPFEVPGGDNSSLAMMRRIREMPLPKTGRDDCPAALERILAQATAKDPDARPVSAMALAQSLRAVEIEQRWSPTPLVLLEPEPVPGAASDDPVVRDGANGEVAELEESEDRTRRQGVQRVVAQPSAPRNPAGDDRGDGATVRRAGVSPVASPNPRERVGMALEPDSQGTVRRAVTATVTPEDEAEAEAEVAEPSRPRRRSLIAALVLAVGAAAAIGVFAASGGGGPHKSSPPSNGPTVTADPLDGSLGTPVVTGARQSPTVVHFSWNYANQLPSDQFRVTVVGGTVTTVTSPSIDEASTGQVCIQVQAGRADGSAASPISSPVCAG